MTLSNLSVSAATARASNFLAAGKAAFTTLWCYAKIAPAALQRGEFDDRGDESAEALGRRLEFRTRDFPQLTPVATRRAVQPPCMARS
jgi:hypothetical protein